MNTEISLRIRAHRRSSVVLRPPAFIDKVRRDLRGAEAGGAAKV